MLGHPLNKAEYNLHRSMLLGLCQVWGAVGLLPGREAPHLLIMPALSREVRPLLI